MIKIDKNLIVEEELVYHVTEDGVIGEVHVPMDNTGLYVHVHEVVVRGNRVYLQWGTDLIEINDVADDSTLVGVASCRSQVVYDDPDDEANNIRQIYLYMYYTLPDTIRKELGL